MHWGLTLSEQESGRRNRDCGEAGVEVRLLGEVGLAGDDGRVVPVAGVKQRTMLAMLALHIGRTVPVARLVDVGWGDRTPDTARRQAVNCVSALRQLLGPAVVSVHSGYLLEGVPVDLVRFEAAVTRAREAARHRTEDAIELLDRALALWRGPALGGTAGLPAQAARLDDMRLDALEQRAELHLTVGRHAALVPELTGLINDHPHREGLVAALMLALYRSGRQAAALETYRRTVARLADELGIDPGPQLRQRHAAILRGDPALDQPAPPAARPAAPPAAPLRPAPSGPSGGARGPEPHGTGPVDPEQVRPAHLPATSAPFVGRAAVLRRLDALVPGADGPGTSTAAISAVAGAAGVGKTTLALHWAHRVADRFPDGQLFVDLRGFDPAGPPVDPSEALRLFLGALGVAADCVPADRQAQIGLYRSLLAGRRVLVVLDNARDADQVRPLLPGAPGCLTLVTSRDQLAGLVAGEGAHLVTLDLLPAPEARDLLARRLGRARVAAEPRATDEIVAACARLPLALAVVAARAAAHPGFPLDALARELQDSEDRLAPFDTADATVDIRAAFSCSYRAVTPAAARLFRLLGLHPGPDFTVPAAASLAGAGRERVRPWLAELTRAHLVAEQVPGRFVLHDLLRAYAADLAERLDSGAERRAARLRLLDHHLHTAKAAGALLHPLRDPIAPAAPAPGVTPESLADRPRALAWCIAEHRVLLALIRLAAGHGFDDHCWQLGQHARAVGGYRHAAALFQEIGDRHAAAIRAQLAALGHPDVGPTDLGSPDPAAIPGPAPRAGPATGPGRPRAGRRRGRAARSAGR
jgi:DNA-binding SARP family transcriptional activator